jgi:hypothetical protein
MQIIYISKQATGPISSRLSYYQKHQALFGRSNYISRPRALQDAISRAALSQLYQLELFPLETPK